MHEKRKLKLDLEIICAAMEDNSLESRYFLDLETGEVLYLSEYMDTQEAEELTDRMDAEMGRYEEIEKVGSSEAYRDMEDFIATVEDERLAELLEVAIDGKGAFRRFKDVLLRFPEERERWFRFKDARFRERALEWLEEIGVEPV